MSGTRGCSVPGGWETPTRIRSQVGDSPIHAQRSAAERAWIWGSGSAAKRAPRGGTPRLTSLQGPDPVTLAYSYDGPLMTQLTYQGAVNATLAWTFDPAFRLVTESVQGQPHAITYDVTDRRHRDDGECGPCS